MTDAKRATVQCFGCERPVQWDLARRVVALRDLDAAGRPREYQLCGRCMTIVDEAQRGVK